MRQFLIPVLLVSVALLSSSVTAKESCESLKTKIEAKLAGKGVKAYSLTMISPEDAKGIDTEKVDAKGRRVVASCDGGKQKILYQRTAAVL